MLQAKPYRGSLIHFLRIDSQLLDEKIRQSTPPE